MMLKDLSLWSNKLKEGLQLAHSFHQDYGTQLPTQVKKIAFVGMGGSGIAGKIMKTFLDRKSGMISFIVDTPIIPEGIQTDTLAIVVSYSGQTWETLDVLDQLTQKFVPTIVLAHGGQAIQKAQSKDIPFVLLPDCPTPRSALGYFLGFLAGLFDLMGFLPGITWANSWIESADRYIPSFLEGSFYKDFLYAVNGCDFFHVWGVEGDSGAAAYRATTQFNENAKVQAVYSGFPELSHNLLVGFESFKTNPSALLFHTDFLPAHVSMAIQSISEILKEKRVVLYKPPVFGDTFQSQLFIMILWADFASYHLGHARGVDPVRVQIIEELKKRHKTKGI